MDCIMKVGLQQDKWQGGTVEMQTYLREEDEAIYAINILANK